MNIEKKEYATSFRRSTAVIIDASIVTIVRAVVMQILGMLWLSYEVVNFQKQFNEKFGTETIKNVPEHIDFIIHHRIFFCSLIFYAIIIFIGTVYHAYLNSSAWQGTIGKRLTKIMISQDNDDNSKIGFSCGMAHYFLSILPLAFIIYLISFQISRNLTFFQAVTASEAHVFLSISLVIWVQIQLFTKKKTTAYDTICRVIFINGKTSAKWPWSKH
jgi:uncharacterized RDD family membrane protein YckC